MPTPMTEEQKQRYMKACEQTDAIFKLEGFHPDEEIRTIDQAVIEGRVTINQVNKERVEYIKINGSSNGFIKTRNWI
jgi:phosphoglycerate-specific signal transduction histidine kinase